MVLTTCFDFDISASVADPSSGWGNTLADYGELPGYLVAAASSLAMLLLAIAALAAEGCSPAKVPPMLGLLLLLTFSLGGSLHFITRVDQGACAVAALILLTLVLPPVLVLCFRRSAARTQLSGVLRPWQPVATAVVLLALSGGFTVTALKQVWGRAVRCV